MLLYQLQPSVFCDWSVPRAEEPEADHGVPALREPEGLPGQVPGALRLPEAAALRLPDLQGREAWFTSHTSRAVYESPSAGESLLNG